MYSPGYGGGYSAPTYGGAATQRPAGKSPASGVFMNGMYSSMYQMPSYYQSADVSSDHALGQSNYGLFQHRSSSPYRQSSVSMGSKSLHLSPVRSVNYPRRTAPDFSPMVSRLDNADRQRQESFRILPGEPTPEELSIYELGRKPSGFVYTTKGNQAVEFWDGVTNIPLAAKH